MNIYKVTLDNWGMDEYDSFVVYANSSSSAASIVMAKVNPDYKQHWQHMESVELLGCTDNCDLYPDTSIILGSFNAG